MQVDLGIFGRWESILNPILCFVAPSPSSTRSSRWVFSRTNGPLPVRLELILVAPTSEI